MPIFATDVTSREDGRRAQSPAGHLRATDQAAPAEIPAIFREAIAQLASVEDHRGLSLAEVPAPVSAAPFAVALGAETTEASAASATGRFMLLYNPVPPSSWGGLFRIVTYVRADLDDAMGNDPLLSSVAWDWLLESLDGAGAEYTRLGGTATRVLKESFGTLAADTPNMDIELRASWTPSTNVAAHLDAWQSVLAAFAGLPPEIDGVATLPGLRYT